MEEQRTNVFFECFVFIERGKIEGIARSQAEKIAFRFRVQPIKKRDGFIESKSRQFHLKRPPFTKRGGMVLNLVLQKGNVAS